MTRTAPVSETVWNQDGTWGVYGQQFLPHHGIAYGPGYSTALIAVSKDGEQKKTLVSGHYPRSAAEASEINEFAYPSFVMWAPDGDHVLFFKGHIESIAIEVHGAPLFDVSVKTGEVRLLSNEDPKTREKGHGRITFNNSYSFSPDGELLLLSLGSGKFSNKNKRLAVFDYETLERTWLTSPEYACSAPSWSPDGTRIVYFANPETLTEERIAQYSGPWTDDNMLYDFQNIWVINADGTGRRQLTLDPDFTCTYPKWISPNVVHFLRIPLRSDDHEIWRMRPDGSRKMFVRKLGSGEWNSWTRRDYD